MRSERRSGPSSVFSPCSEVDVVVDKFVEALEKHGLIDRTPIVVTSDNGGIPADRALGHDAVSGLHGSKSRIWEGGHRVPFMVPWKGHVLQAGRIQRMEKLDREIRASQRGVPVVEQN